MTSGVEDPPRASPSRRPFPRWIFGLALVSCALVTGWTAMSILAHVTPALFPSRSLPGVDELNALLPAPLDIDEPDEGAGFRGRQNLLIIGLDARPGLELLDLWRTDTIMVATIDPNANVAAILSFPRDLLIDIHNRDSDIGVYQDRINVSYQRGVLHENSFAGGAGQLALDLERNFGIEIDHWIVLDFTAVQQLVDAIGGLYVDISPALAVPEWLYSDDDETAYVIRFDAGPQKIDGYHAVAFGRYREDSDLNRVKRQELIVRAVFAQVFGERLLDDALSLWNAFSDLIQTDIPAGLVPGYALMLKDLEGRIATYSLGDDVNGVPTVENHLLPARHGSPEKWVLTWRPENVRYWLRLAFAEGDYAHVHVEVRDGSGADGGALAESLARYLRVSHGLPLVSLGSAVAARPTTTIVFHDEGSRALALDVAGWLGVGADAITLREPAGGDEPDLVIIVGAGFELPDG